jgi:hypothetical protein
MIMDLWENNQSGRREAESFLSIILHHIPRDKDIRVLEVGCWMGNATKMLLSVLRQRSGSSHIDVIDTFTGEDQPNDVSNPLQDIGTKVDVKSKFIENMKSVEGMDQITIHQGRSEDVLPTLTEKYDFIFLDGSHRYKVVRQDITNSWNLTKVGGFLTGHDCDTRKEWVHPTVLHMGQDYDCYGFDIADPHKGTTGILHCGVIKAVGELFPNHNLLYNKVWFVHKTGNSQYTIINPARFYIPLIPTGPLDIKWGECNVITGHTTGQFPEMLDAKPFAYLKLDVTR